MKYAKTLVQNQPALIPNPSRTNGRGELWATAKSFVFVAAAIASGWSWVGSTRAAEVELFPLSAVKVAGGPFRQAQELNRAVLRQYDPDRLLAPFRKDAGLPTKGEVYPNWEGTGLGGQTAGHYLTALAQLAAAGDTEAAAKLAYMVADLAIVQKDNGNGYVGGVPDSKRIWQEVADGEIQARAFDLNGGWVPWYNLHKLFAGLRDAWLVAGNQQAREVLIGLTDWCENLVSNLDDRQMQRMLRTEHGGMNEVFADLYAATGEEKYLDLAKRFSHRAILDPLLEGRDDLTGKHANTQIPKVVGYARIGELAGEASWLDAAKFFWSTVVENRSVAIGGNSESEHFHSADDFSKMISSVQGPETCNTYNMLRLTEVLFRQDPSARYADYYERGLYNHILASQHPRHGGYVYMTPMRPRHYRVYSQPEQCFWCCVGSGMENHGKYGRFIYAASDDALFVNLFIASELDWQAKGVQVRQETNFPVQAGSELVLWMGAPTKFALKIRRPAWATGDFAVKVNGEAQAVESEPSSYVSIDREWSNGDRVDVSLPMQIHVEQLPDKSDYAAVMFGPLVLAAATGEEDLEGLVADDGRFAHIASGPEQPIDEAPRLVGDLEEIATKIKPTDAPLTFSAAEAIEPDAFDALKLRPFYQVHDARYEIYWPIGSSSD